MPIDSHISPTELEAVRLELQRRGVRVTLAGMLKSVDAAAFIGIAPKTLRSWRYEGISPEYQVIGGNVFYQLADLVAFVRGASNRPMRPAASRTVLDSAPRKAQSETMIQTRLSTLRVQLPAPVASTIRALARKEACTVSDLLAEALRSYPPVISALQSSSTTKGNSA